jgi:hypothetical protein
MIGPWNALLGKCLGAEQQVVNGIDVAGSCNELAGRLNDCVSAAVDAGLSAQHMACGGPVFPAFF